MHDSIYAKHTYNKKPNEVQQQARSRLKDALQDLVATDEESDLNDSSQNLPMRGRPKKSIKTEPEEADHIKETFIIPDQQQIHESFVMKLFDRSLDLSKYDDHTALYPICRAWMANTPRSASIKIYRDRRSPSPDYRENDGGEVLENLRNGDLTEISIMPAPLNTELLRIPTPMEDEENEQERKKAELSLRGASKTQLLASHKHRWKKMRKRWQNHTKRYQEEKYELNYQIIDELYKC